MISSKVLCIAFVAVAFAAAPKLADASTVFDTDLADPPGFYNGSGSPNGHFVVNTENNVEIALRTIHRNVGPVTPTSDATYHVPTGDNSPFSTARAWWNFEYSVNLRADGSGTLTNGDVTPTITVLNQGNGLSVTLNPFVYFPDNAGWNGSETAQVPNPFDPANDVFFASYGFQNSENLTFGQFAPLLFDFNEDNTFVITLSVLGPNGLNMSVSETVVVGAGAAAAVPIPAALPLFASGLGAITFLARRRRKSQVKV